MTKSEEMVILDRAIAELGPDSYLGAWLAGVRGEVERDVRCDILPWAAIADSVAEVERVRAECAAEVARVQEAHHATLALLAAAREAEVDRVRDEVAGMARRLERAAGLRD